QALNDLQTVRLAERLQISRADCRLQLIFHGRFHAVCWTGQLAHCMMRRREVHRVERIFAHASGSDMPGGGMNVSVELQLAEVSKTFAPPQFALQNTTLTVAPG